jgi:hypothetical protein
MCFILPKIRGNVPARYIEHDSRKLPTDMIFANPGFLPSEYVHVLTAAELLFHMLRLGKYTDGGRVPTLQDTELGLILAERNSIQCNHSEKKQHCV